MQTAQACPVLFSVLLDSPAGGQAIPSHQSRLSACLSAHSSVVRSGFPSVLLKALDVGPY